MRDEFGLVDHQDKKVNCGDLGLSGVKKENL
jgi:hypothetical protein